MVDLVFTDIHGSLEKLLLLWDKVKNQRINKLIFLGDYIDRGPDAKGVLDFLMKLSRDYDSAILRGNHEDYLLELLLEKNKRNLPLHCWYTDNIVGGNATLTSFSGDPFNREVAKKVREIPLEYIEFIKGMEYFYETEEYFFVHAGVNPHKGISTRNIEHLTTIRDFFLKSERDYGKIVVHGHTYTKNFQPEVKHNRICLDTGCAYGGKLTCMQLPERIFYQV